MLTDKHSERISKTSLFANYLPLEWNGCGVEKKRIVFMPAKLSQNWIGPGDEQPICSTERKTRCHCEMCDN